MKVAIAIVPSMLMTSDNVIRMIALAQADGYALAFKPLDVGEWKGYVSRQIGRSVGNTLAGIEACCDRAYVWWDKSDAMLKEIARLMAVRWFGFGAGELTTQLVYATKEQPDVEILRALADSYLAAMQAKTKETKA